MQHEQRRVVAPDGISLHVEQWTPSDKVEFVAVISHGGAEHVGRFARLAEMLAKMGGLVVGLDHRGQGLTGGIRGHVEAFEDYASDLRQVILDAAGRLPEDQQPSSLPWFLFGHSMGGLISLTYLLEQARAPAQEGQVALSGKVQALPLRGAIISSPLIEVAVKVNVIKRWVGQLAAKIWPTLSLPTGIPANAICRDPDEVARYERDSRRVGVVSAGWFAAMNRATARVRAEVGTIELPCLWYVGTGDTICSHEASLAVYRSIPEPEARGTSLHVFDGYYHELHNEPAELRAPVMEVVSEWVRARLD